MPASNPHRLLLLVVFLSAGRLNPLPLADWGQVALAATLLSDFGSVLADPVVTSTDLGTVP